MCRAKITEYVNDANDESGNQEKWFHVQYFETTFNANWNVLR